jgi:ribonuclease PH
MPVNKRIDGREFSEIRSVTITPGFMPYAEGSALIEQGYTKVICSVTLEERVPVFLKGKGTGWITAEYAMLPRSTIERTPRDITIGRISGRSQEIQRLIGRSLRAVIDLNLIGERTLIVDCDVLQADGGTRTAAITGSYVALHLACQALLIKGLIPRMPLETQVAAISVGLLNSDLMLDICYDEDQKADADFNIVMNGRNEFIEIQGTAEGKNYSKNILDSVIALAERGITELFKQQKIALG